MKIGFAKIGQSWEPRLSHATTGQVDVVRSLTRLRLGRPNDEWTVIGKTRADPRASFPGVRAPWWDGELTAARAAGPAAEMSAMIPWAEKLDALVIWLGQIGGAATPLPKLDGSGPIRPLQMDERYAAYICALVNCWRELNPTRDVVWLCGDARNRFALHDFRAPPSRSILAQYDQTKNGVFWQGGSTFHRSAYTYAYGAVELTGVPDPGDWPTVFNGGVPFGNREAFGVVANENKRVSQNGRAAILRDWVGDVDALELYGAWSPAGLAEMGRTRPVARVPEAELPRTVGRWKATLTMPASGSGWATSKPWEMFAAATVCFFHPAYDDQGHVIATTPSAARSAEEELLVEWLRPKTPGEFHASLSLVTRNVALWERLVAAQHKHLTDRFLAERGGIATTLQRLAAHDVS